MLQGYLSLSQLLPPGTRVARGDPLALVHAADLSADMGLLGQLMHPKVMDVMTRAARRCAPSAVIES